jgi:hypothetical protein
MDDGLGFTGGDYTISPDHGPERLEKIAAPPVKKRPRRWRFFSTTDQ